MSGKISGDVTVPFKSSIFVPGVDLSLPVGAQNVKLLAGSLQANVISPSQYGAVGDGVADDTAAIQQAIDAAALAGGGTVQLGVGKYRITNTLRVGNGSPSAVSTHGGVYLAGVPPVAAIFWPGYTIPSATRITWAGGALDMIDILGPLMGWGVQDIELIGNSVATYGLHVVSAKYGDCRNLVISGCTVAAIGSDTVPMIGTNTNTDSMYNSYSNIYIGMPPAANVKGIVLTGAVGTITSDTDMNIFENIFIVLPSSGVAYAIYLQNCDANQFQSVALSGGSAAAFGVIFDYSANASGAFPLGNGFFGIDTNGDALGANQWANFGTPSISARPNYVRGMKLGDGTVNPSLPNLQPDLPVQVGPHVFVLNQSAAIAGTNLYQAYATGIYRISVYLGIQAVGNPVTVTASVGWNDGAARVLSTQSINLSTGANNPQALTWTVVHNASQVITYATTVSGAPGAGTYMLAIVVERLS